MVLSSFSPEEITLPKRIWFQRPFNLRITFDPRSNQGRFRDRLELVFLDTMIQTQFVITRPLVAIVSSQADWDLTKPSAPYQPKLKGTQQPEKEVIPGIKPPQIADIEWVVDLPQAPIPKMVEEMLGKSNPKIVLRDLQRTWLPRELNSESYGRHYKVLLHVEEAQMKCWFPPHSWMLYSQGVIALIFNVIATRMFF